MLYAGYAVPPFYDSLLGKLIVWDESRAAAITRLLRALEEFEIEGLPTTIGLHQALARDDDVRALRFNTGFLEHWLKTNASHLA
jgi:acetyl-CoA carboxylase biotin carboxylase subunit